jgi:hypothetical protein
MHFHCEVWVPKKEDYISQVHKALAGLSEEDTRISDEDCGNGFYDWYVIGGRWSGEHTMWLLRKNFGDKIEKISKEFEKEFGWFTNGENSREKRAKQYEEVFRRHISKEEWSGEPLPSWRNSYKEDGFDDDIIAISDVPWEQFDCYTLMIDGYIYHELKREEAIKMFKDHKIESGYLVTIDYHS